jgi:4-hydroxy-tetrahydrodipicolinate synthase
MIQVSGTITAIVTPFLADGTIDFHSFETLLERQISAGIESVVVCGSTGEGATLTFEEKCSLFRFAVEKNQKRIPIIAGTGSNDTRASIELTQAAEQCGVDAMLVVAPFYNKPTQHGLFEHFRAIAASTELPIILYNVPGRTACNMTAETQLKIAEHCKNVIATKEASADLEQMMEIIRNAPDHFTLLAGDDALALPIIACGGKGVVSVISNIIPLEFGNSIRMALNGNYAEAREQHLYYLSLMKACFIESNPIPAKTLLAEMGLLQDNFRLPLTQIQNQNRQRLQEIKNRYNL